jgi:hypothetical protein
MGLKAAGKLEVYRSIRKSQALPDDRNVMSILSNLGGVPAGSVVQKVGSAKYRRLARILANHRPHTYSWRADPDV